MTIHRLLLRGGVAFALAFGSLAAPALAGDFGLARSPGINAPASLWWNPTDNKYNPHSNGTAGDGAGVFNEGTAISARNGLENAALNMEQLNLSGQASPKGTPGN
jgi:hypothetical protein